MDIRDFIKGQNLIKAIFENDMNTKEVEFYDLGMTNINEEFKKKWQTTLVPIIQKILPVSNIFFHYETYREVKRFNTGDKQFLIEIYALFDKDSVAHTIRIPFYDDIGFKVEYLEVLDPNDNLYASLDEPGDFK